MAEVIEIPDELIERIARRAAELLAERPAEDRWLNVAEAAEHIRAKPQRLYALVSARRIPFHKDGSRLLFRRSEIDAWLEAGGGIRP